MSPERAAQSLPTISQKLEKMRINIGFVTCLAVLDDGRLASGSLHAMIQIWDLAMGACVATLEGHEHSVESLAVLEDGRLASGSSDQTINIWDLGTDEWVATLEGHDDPTNPRGTVWSLAVLESGRLASGSTNGTIAIWDSALSFTLR